MCGYCAFMVAAEDGAVILLDGLEFGPPRVALTLTTRDPEHGTERFREDVKHLMTFLRKRLDRVEYFSRIEYTTGKGARSGGKRRLHSHNLLKYVTPEEAAALETEVRDFWERRTGAWRIELAELRSSAGAMHYITEHFSKSRQRPAKGWKGRRTRYSKGYFTRPNEQRREQARELLTDRRTERRLRALMEEHSLDLDDFGDDSFDDLIDRHVEGAKARAMGMRLVRVAELPTEFDSDGLPTSWELQVLGEER